MTSPAEVLGALALAGVVPVVEVDRPRDAVTLVHVLEAAGLGVLEVTLRTPAALEAIELAARARDDVMVGAGTLLSADQVDAAQRRGAAFGVAPGLDRASVATASSCALPFVPGVVTPSEAMAALAMGMRHLKFFPAAASGGIDAVRALAATLGPAGARFLPTGGVDAGNAADYLALPEVFAVGGSWIAPRTDIHEGAWPRIEARARAAVELVAALRGHDPVAASTRTAPGPEDAA